MSEQSGQDGHPDAAALNRLAEEGEAPTASPVLDHVRGCARCRREVAGIRRVLRAARALPEEIPPGRDLWSGVEVRVRSGRHRALARSDREGGPAGGEGRDGRAEEPVPLRRAAPWLAAAAAVLVAVTAGATLWLAGGEETARIADSGAPGIEVTTTGPTAELAAAPASLQGVRSAYVPIVDRLGELVERRSDRLPPDARRVLERNLRIIDAAIAEAEAALAERPSSPELARALDRTYERKLELLQRSVRLAARL